MKKYILTIFLSVCLTNFSVAQTLVGKWTCTTKCLTELGFGYTNISGKCKFKKNGTFIVRIKGRHLPVQDTKRHTTTMYAKQKGHY